MKRLINNYKKWNPSTYAVIFLLLLPFVMFIIRGFSLDNDFWFLINTGKTIIKEGFIRIEPFTIHSGLAFLPQQWLSDIIFWLIYDNFGIRGMYYLVILCNCLVIFIMYKISYLISENKKRSVLITVVADFVLLGYYIMTTRPQLFDVIIIALELLLLESFVKKNAKIYLCFLPLMSIFLINCHASIWPMFFVFAIPYFIEWIILKYKKKELYNIMPLIISFALSFLCGLINPYGIESIKYFFNSYGVYKINNMVLEMQEMIISNLAGKYAFLIIFIMLYSFYYNKGNNKIRYFLLCMGISYLTLSHYRGILFLAIIMPIIYGYNYKKKTIYKDIKLRFVDKFVYVTCSIGLFIAIIFAVPLSEGVGISNFANYLDQNASFDIKLFTGYNYGAYMEYRGYKCYIDSRAEVFLKKNNHVEDIFDEYYDLSLGKLDPKKFLNKYQFDYVLTGERDYTFLYELNNNQDYELVMKEKNNRFDEMMYLFKNNSGEKNEKSN